MAELSPEEARLFKLTAEPSEALSMEIFNEMKAWSPELQRKASEALRDCWTALGKWNGKQSKKQEAKIKTYSHSPVGGNAFSQPVPAEYGRI